MKTWPTTKSLTICVSLVFSLLVIQACVKIGGDPAEQEREAQEIERYASRTQSLDKTRTHLLDTWDRLADAPTYEEFSATLRARVLPAVEGYLTALESIDPEIPELRKTHGALVESYGRFVRGLRALSSRSQAEAPEKVETDLRKLLLDARQAQMVYRQDISSLYARNGYRLVVEEEMGAGSTGTEDKIQDP